MQSEMIEMYFHAHSCGVTDNDASRMFGVPIVSLWKLRKGGTSNVENLSNGAE